MFRVSSGQRAYRFSKAASAPFRAQQDRLRRCHLHRKASSLSAPLTLARLPRHLRPSGRAPPCTSAPSTLSDSGPSETQLPVPPTEQDLQTPTAKAAATAPSLLTLYGHSVVAIHGVARTIEAPSKRVLFGSVQVSCRAQLLQQCSGTLAGILRPVRESSWMRWLSLCP
ncbi:hypothetical protein NDU88_005615 [Pleurodeles waltl]|uniref:Uncharacterized protein n=1 Tax=Pleurodeles waltl TaxID=8319 RepID=A0AAV7PFX9_PLEWA|nr:hypothetical protein NDU88_005615 [Pleurodeles waltl]